MNETADLRKISGMERLDLPDYKFWQHIARVDNVFGDRNPVYSCVGMESYQS